MKIPFKCIIESYLGLSTHLITKSQISTLLYSLKSKIFPKLFLIIMCLVSKTNHDPKYAPILFI